MENIKEHIFEVPSKKIKDFQDMRKFEESWSYKMIIDFIKALSSVVRGKSLTEKIHISENVKRLLEILDYLSGLVDKIPPLTQPTRYGNKAFRIWHKEVVKESERLISGIGSIPEKAVQEIKEYFEDSFGNSTRVDYGTGHELHFLVFMFCLFVLRVFNREDFCALVIHVFEKYLCLCRKLQAIYMLEPAGSHGVWSLDDFHFLPFIFGSSQLIDHPEIIPDSILHANTIEKYHSEYLYLSCIKHINDVKTGPFNEHSPDLYNISGAANWQKINNGMIRKYSDDVLGKFPVIQHFLFGSIVPFSGYYKMIAENVQ